MNLISPAVSHRSIGLKQSVDTVVIISKSPCPRTSHVSSWRDTAGVSVFIFLFLFSSKLFAQDVVGSGAWLGLDLKHKLSKKWDINFCPQLRTLFSPLQFNSVLLEGGLDYDATKNITLSGFYRADLSVTAIQHRVYADFSFDHKFKKKITGSIRLRAQRQFERANIPDNYLRPKLSFKYKLTKKITPFISGELFYHVYYKGNQFDNFRFETGANLDLKHNRSIKAYYLLDKEFNVKAAGMQHIAGLTFGMEW